MKQTLGSVAPTMAVRPRYFVFTPIPAMKNVPHTVTDAAIATIRERIETSVYPVGSLLPAQRQLSEELAISRASLREALTDIMEAQRILAHASAPAS